MLMMEVTLRVRDEGVRLWTGLRAAGYARVIVGLIASNILAPSYVTDFIFIRFLLESENVFDSLVGYIVAD